ncbi:MAG: redoxin domain-containing protein [Tissierellia bacterium]|jgi:peroxiredoxin (alkyl hydroperoxide reductase subunit C)|nr:redoxin domain-containing protein [Tissierellia bacterium]
MIYNSSINNINQPERTFEPITIGRLAPDFVALSTQGYIRLSDYRGKWVILTSHPQAFGAVSTTEIISSAQNYPRLSEQNIEIIGLTTDNIYSILAWINDIYQNTGISIPFPIIADTDLALSEMYGMISPDRMFGVTVRSTFIIDPSGRIRAVITLPVSTGGNQEELLRILDSILVNENYNLHTPANWKPGDPLVVPNPVSYEEMVSRAENSESLGYYCPFWYLCYTYLNSNNISSPPGQTNNNISSR